MLLTTSTQSLVRTHTSIPSTTSLHILAVDSRRGSVVKVSLLNLLFPVVVHVHEVERVDVAREVPEDREADVLSVYQ